MKRRKSGLNPCNSSSGQKHNSPDLVDRISALPDSILGLILSLIPTKNVVATSILSKRWKFVWMTIHNLDFCYDDCETENGEGENKKFVQFVDRVLLLHHDGLLNKFNLVCDFYCISSHAISWIDTAITRNVSELSLCALLPDMPQDYFDEPFDIPEPFELPTSVFTCNSLQSLELTGHISVSTTIAVSLPRLKSLKLSLIEFRSEEAFENLVSGCPMLTFLNLHVDNEMEDSGIDPDAEAFMYTISSTSLRRLELYFSHVINCSLKLEASSLEYFKLHGFISEIFVQKNLTSLVEVDFRLEFHEYKLSQAGICDSIIEVIRAFDCTRALALSADAMWALSCGSIKLSTEFKRLVKLETNIYCCHCSALLDLVQSSNNLEALTIKKIYHRMLYFGNHDHLNWTTPVEVPRCLSTSLKNMSYENFSGLEDAYEMIGYILKHGSALEVMHISSTRDLNCSMFECFEEICEYPRKSPLCEIKFIGWTSNGNNKVCCTVLPTT